MTSENFYKSFGVPEYVGDGEILDIYPCANGCYQLCVKGVSRESLDAYVRQLELDGFELILERVLGRNSFSWYEGESCSVYLSFMPDVSTVRMICGDVKPITVSERADREAVARAAVSQLQIKVGMCYCISLTDGTFLIIDGGCSDEEDMERLYRFIKERSGAHQKPVVRAWFITHTHPDHIRLAQDFIIRYRDDVELMSTVYNFPDFQSVTVVHESAENNYKAAVGYEQTVKDCYPNAEHIICHTGDVMELAGVRVTTVMTHEDIYPVPIVSSNHTSCAWRFDFDSGDTFMCLGDIWTEMCEQMAKTFGGEYLKSDIMQVTHHGLLGGHIELYRAIDPEICLWPSPVERFEGTWTDPRRVKIGKPTVQYCIGEGGCDYNQWIRDDSVKKRKHFSAGETVTIPV